jgi:hypothetical protein
VDTELVDAQQCHLGLGVHADGLEPLRHHR